MAGRPRAAVLLACLVELACAERRVGASDRQGGASRFPPTVYLLASLKLPSTMAAHLGKYKLRGGELYNGRPVYDAASKETVLRWTDGFWLVSPSHVAFNTTRAHMNVKSGALTPWDVESNDWQMVHKGNWTTQPMRVHTGADGHARFQAAVRHIARIASLS